MKCKYPDKKCYWRTDDGFCVYDEIPEKEEHERYETHYNEGWF